MTSSVKGGEKPKKGFRENRAPSLTDDKQCKGRREAQERFQRKQGAEPNR